MSVYMTEEEQLDQIKKWWRRYGNMITMTLSVILLCIAGYRYWNWHQDKIKQQASATYENMMVALSNKNIKSVRAYAGDLIKNYNNTIYSDVAHMTMAKVYVDKSKLPEAIHELQIVATNSKMTPLKQIAKIRIARLMAGEKSYTNALNELSVVDDPIYLPVINELKGDIYSAKGQYQEAISAYREAINEVRTNGMGNLFLEMKTNELAVKTQSMMTQEKKVKSA
ncbi:YfgM family protein [Legionella waltersii]|uniref:Ancillary SecYEG translocon subunit n=1 Tax=Legionella waltersii TaxID=66969 RepID=A0A0W1A133_9GAMM|nr:tetratricopeptide repeat protein [Legionella waltersii]KTD75054.1 transmembrane protein [Legionella waltersii]SNV05354.1 transmembrane protein [Legionella waltersii]